MPFEQNEKSCKNWVDKKLRSRCWHQLPRLQGILVLAHEKNKQYIER